ncbi:putative transmembrane protein [Toxoplasma gondii VAND]|uniref:Putative transmembrane protein n=1 Tax=Toxoplasma gondii VAND TaxID=933077 RepID=A0A086QIM4_TOXGO|nr:putative transmembrane protein [Toxoplasma gondii VAND]
MTSYSLSPVQASFDGGFLEDDSEASFLNEYAVADADFPLGRPRANFQPPESHLLPTTNPLRLPVLSTSREEANKSPAASLSDFAAVCRGSQRGPGASAVDGNAVGRKASSCFLNEDDCFLREEATLLQSKAKTTLSPFCPVDAGAHRALPDRLAPAEVVTEFEAFSEAGRERRTDVKMQDLHARGGADGGAHADSQHCLEQQTLPRAERTTALGAVEPAGAEKAMRSAAPGRREETGETSASSRHNEEFGDVFFGEDGHRGDVQEISRGPQTNRDDADRGRSVCTLASQTGGGGGARRETHCSPGLDFGLQLSPQQSEKERASNEEAYEDEEEEICLQPGPLLSARHAGLSPQLSPRCMYTQGALPAAAARSAVERVPPSTSSGQGRRKQEGRVQAFEKTEGASAETEASFAPLFSVPADASNVSARTTLLGRSSYVHFGKGSRYASPAQRHGEAPSLSLSAFSLVQWREALSIVANRLYYSRFTAYLYLFVFLLNAWVLLRCLTLSVVNVWVVAAEVFVTFMLLLEVSLRALVVGRAFFFKFENLFDVAVTVLCVALLCISDDLWGSLADRDRPPPEEVDDIFRQSLTAFRFSTQLLRMVTIALHQKRSQLPSDDVDFSYLEAQARAPHDDGL